MYCFVVVDDLFNIFLQTLVFSSKIGKLCGECGDGSGDGFSGFRVGRDVFF